MFGNYVKSAIRNLTRQRLYTAINVLGLAIGLAACLLIIGYVNNELSFENCHQNRGRIYRIDGMYSLGNAQVSMASIMPAVGGAVREAYPEVEQVDLVRMMIDILPEDVPLDTALRKLLIAQAYKNGRRQAPDKGTLPAAPQTLTAPKPVQPAASPKPSPLEIQVNQFGRDLGEYYRAKTEGAGTAALLDRIQTMRNTYEGSGIDLSILDKEEKDLRTPAPADRRTNIIVLTSAGRKLLCRVEPLYEQEIRNRMDNMGENEQKKLIQLLEKIRLNIAQPIV